MTATPHVRVLMGTWNGTRHLLAQLDSFLAQNHADWSLIARDDGSTDATPTYLAAFRNAHPDRAITLLPPAKPPAGTAPRGAAANFLRLLAHSVTLSPALTAFADQDDIWLPHKLARAIHMLGPDVASNAPPAVYASRSIHADATLHPRGPSALHPRPSAFANALVQNVLAGNTIVMNPAATALVAATCPAALAGDGVPFHDWWVYLVAAGAGARIVNDPEPGLLYRQHGSNVLGAHAGLTGTTTRLVTVLRGGWRGWIGLNLAALAEVADLLAPDHRATFDGFVALRRNPSPLARLTGLYRLGIHRQTRAGDALIRALALAGQL